jgi:phosphohistidine swiveling domain-containing protein
MPMGHSPDPQPAVLDLASATELALAGGKAAALARMAAAGLPVPPSGVVTTAVYERLAGRPPVQALLEQLARGEVVPPDEVDRAFTEAAFTVVDRAAILDLARRIARPDSDGLALRSSATVEDMGQSSFAGQYRSFLRIDADDDHAVLRAVALVFASLWHPAPRAYRHHLGIDEGHATMAVLVMPMIPARRAGVAFTVDPGGTPGAARIEWLDGTAEDLVSGARTPQSRVVPREPARPAEDIPGDDVDPVVEATLALALAAEAVADCPQDVEWAWDGETTWLVQARPITTGDRSTGDGFDSPTEPDVDLTSASIGEVLPGVIPPLAWGLASHLVEQALRSLMAALGSLPSEPDGPIRIVRRVRGRAAMALGSVSDLGGAGPHTSASEAVDAFLGVDAEAGSRGRTRRRGLPWRVVHDVRVLRLQALSTRSALVAVEAARQLSANLPDLGSLDDRHLLAYELRLVDLGVRAASAEIGVAAAAVSAHDRLVGALARGLRRDDARRAADRFVARSGVVAAAPPTASASYFAGPTWQELGLDPPEGHDPGDRSLPEAIDELLAEVPEPGSGETWLTGPLRLRRIERSAEDAVDWLELRERAKGALLAIGGEVRRVHLEMGSRLAERGLLETADDVDLLSHDEVGAGLAGAVAVTPATIDRRRRALARAHRAGPLPLHFRGEPGPIAAPDDGADRIVGTSLSPGSHRGPAVRVDDPRTTIAPGTVVVAVATDPSWAPLLIDAGALVVEQGGPLSHTAILSRELGVPAVSGVRIPPEALDGLELTVDGDRGTVDVHRVQR